MESITKWHTTPSDYTKKLSTIATTLPQILESITKRHTTAVDYIMKLSVVVVLHRYKKIRFKFASKRGFQRIKECVIWIPDAKVMKVQMRRALKTRTSVVFRWVLKCPAEASEL